MRAKDAARLSAIRLLLAAIKQREVDERKELGDPDVTSVIEKMIKQRRESIAHYEQAARKDLADAEKFELEILSAYLPQQMSREEIIGVARSVINRIGATGPADKGKVMPVVMAELRDRAEGREINAVVTELLAGG